MVKFLFRESNKTHDILAGLSRAVTTNHIFKGKCNYLFKGCATTPRHVGEQKVVQMQPTQLTKTLTLLLLKTPQWHLPTQRIDSEGHAAVS